MRRPTNPFDPTDEHAVDQTTQSASGLGSSTERSAAERGKADCEALRTPRRYDELPDERPTASER